MNLYPTPTRVNLLREVEADKVAWHPASAGYPEESICYRSSGPARVTKRCQEMERAGWIRILKPEIGLERWQLTDAGREILRGAS